VVKNSKKTSLDEKLGRLVCRVDSLRSQRQEAE
jgi:hypothetical protein